MYVCVCVCVCVCVRERERERERVCQYKYENSCMTISAGVGCVFTWGYGNDGQLANNENKGRCVSITSYSFTNVRFTELASCFRAQPVEVEVLLDKQVRMIACGAQHMACTVVYG